MRGKKDSMRASHRQARKALGDWLSVGIGQVRRALADPKSW